MDEHTTTDTTRPIKQEQEPATAEVTEVAPGILRTQLPVDMPGLGHVNCYLLEDERGVAVVDPGLPGAAAWDAFVDRLGRAGYRVGDVHTVVVTHSHPDHFGGALRLRYETEADLVTHDTFRTYVDQAIGSEDSGALELNTFDEQMAAIERYFRRPTPWGGTRMRMPDEFFERLRADLPRPHGRYEPLTPSRPLTDGQTIRLARREWVALHTPGHTYDHLCLYDADTGVVLTGDHVLPSITPHIGVLPPHADPLALFFDSLTRMAGMPGVTVALPAHGHPFDDVPGRCEHIAEHHRQRLDVIRHASAELPDGTVDDYMKVLFRERSWGDMAASETFAHLEHLRQAGEFAAVGDGGVVRYRPLG